MEEGFVTSRRGSTSSRMRRGILFHMVSKDRNSRETTLQESMVTDLINLYEEDCSGPFPYADCRKLLASGLAGEGLIPDVDLYFYDIASHCGGARKILKWPREQLLKARLRLGESFFERHPQYG